MSESVEGVTFIWICTWVLFCFLYRRLYLSPFPFNRTFYGIPEDFPRNQVMYRTENGQRRTLYFVSSAIRDLVRKNNDRFKVNSLRIEILVMFKLLEETNDKYYKITVKNKKYCKTCPIKHWTVREILCLITNYIKTWKTVKWGEKINNG